LVLNEKKPPPLLLLLLSGGEIAVEDAVSDDDDDDGDAGKACFDCECDLWLLGNGNRDDDFTGLVIGFDVVVVVKAVDWATTRADKVMCND